MIFFYIATFLFASAYITILLWLWALSLAANDGRRR